MTRDVQSANMISENKIPSENNLNIILKHVVSVNMMLSDKTYSIHILGYRTYLRAPETRGG
jgi:hypothetical protein